MLPASLFLAPEMYSRKVFVGGLPPDICQDEIRDAFIQFGALTADWPHKAESKYSRKGYAFLLFSEEISVHRLVKSCLSEEGKLYTYVSSIAQTKKVQIIPWRLSDSDYIRDHTQPIDARKTIFVGGVSQPLKACELADIFNSQYGNVCYAGFICNQDLKYPIGAGRVTFSSRVSFMSAVSRRFLKVTYGDIDKTVCGCTWVDLTSATDCVIVVSHMCFYRHARPDAILVYVMQCYVHIYSKLSVGQKRANPFNTALLCLLPPKVEVKPYVLEDQMCDKCHGLSCGGHCARYFCGSIHCLCYYCEHCWAVVHAAPGTQKHRCFIKDSKGRPWEIKFSPSQPICTGLRY